MSCAWKEEQAYSFADDSLEPRARQSFAAHLDGCSLCRERVSEARRLESLLRSGLAPVPAPATLASRVAGAVAAERESRPRFVWPLGFGRLSLSPAMAALAATLALAIATTLMVPEAVMAVVQRALVFVPGLGISNVDQGYLVAPAPIAVRDGGVTFTVEALLSDGKQTTAKFTVAGLPGGKSGWDAAGPKRHPYLRDESGREFRSTGGHHGVGGSPAGNRMEGTMYFPALPGELRSVELVMPADHLVPDAVLPGATTREWVARIPLTPATQSGLPRATPQVAAATVRRVTLRVAASSVEPDRTVVLLEGEAAGQARPLFVGKNGGNLAEEVLLRDDRGRTYPWVSLKSRSVPGEKPFQENLQFAPVEPDVQRLTLTVKSLQLQEEERSAGITIPLAGRQRGERFDLNHTLQLGRHQVVLKSARVDTDAGGRPLPANADPEALWLYVEVDLGPTANGETLSSFRLETRGASSMSGMGARSGEQMSIFGIRLEPGQEEVKFTLAAPLVNVAGPWEMSFSVRAEPAP